MVEREREGEKRGGGGERAHRIEGHKMMGTCGGVTVSREHCATGQREGGEGERMGREREGEGERGGERERVSRWSAEPGVSVMP